MLEIQVLDARGERLSCGPVSRYALPEPQMLELSMEFFQDPQPCMIHRSAILCRVYGELEDCLRENGGEMEIADLSTAVRALFEADSQGARVAVCQKETQKKQPAASAGCKKRAFGWRIRG